MRGALKLWATCSGEMGHVIKWLRQPRLSHEAFCATRETITSSVAPFLCGQWVPRPRENLDYQLPHAKRQRGSVHALNAKHLPPRSCFCVVRAPSLGAPNATMAACPDRCRLARDRRVDERLETTSLVGERAGCDLALRTSLAKYELAQLCHQVIYPNALIQKDRPSDISNWLPAPSGCLPTRLSESPRTEMR